MRLYLARHGDAESAACDDTRPLSAKGQQEIEKVAQFLQQSGVHVQQLFHSDKLRAQMTAQLYGQYLAPDCSVEAIDGLRPDDSTDSIAYSLSAWQQDTLLVGHLPYMSRLIGRLISGTEAELTVLNTGSIACLERISGMHWMLCWLICPDLL